MEMPTAALLLTRMAQIDFRDNSELVIPFLSDESILRADYFQKSLLWTHQRFLMVNPKGQDLIFLF